MADVQLPDGAEAEPDEWSAEQWAELERRLTRHRAGRSTAVPWEQIEREIAERYGTDTGVA